jgi:hypothetical protein
VQFTHPIVSFSELLNADRAIRIRIDVLENCFRIRASMILALFFIIGLRRAGQKYKCCEHDNETFELFHYAFSCFH